MTSAKKITANQDNSRRSTGPRTSRGKTRASRNALRHGLAAIELPQPAVSTRIERVAKAIVGDNAMAAQHEQALIIAESELMMLNVRAARVAAIEHHRKITPAGSKPGSGFPGADLEAFRLALPELIKLERYERRAMSRRRHAIRELMELKGRAFYSG
jgi:hypothetical protein